MKYEVGYLTQIDASGRTFANGHGPAAKNIRVVSRHNRKADAFAAARDLIGKRSPMGQIADAYILARGVATEVN